MAGGVQMKPSKKLVLGLAAIAFLGTSCSKSFNRQGHPQVHKGTHQKTAPPVADIVFENMTDASKARKEETPSGRKVELHLGELRLETENKEISFDYDLFQLRVQAKAKLAGKTVDVRLFGQVDATTGE